MPTKLEKLRESWLAGNKLQALKIAAYFPRLGAEKTVITRGWAAHKNPNLYKGMGFEPDSLVLEALEAVRGKYING